MSLVCADENSTSTLEDVNIDANDISMYYKNGTRLSAELNDLNDNPLPDCDLVFSINNQNYTRTTNDDGKASIAINLIPGKYLANIYFLGNNQYSPSNKSVNVNVLPTISGNDLVKYYKNDSQYFATFLGGDGEVLDNMDVTFNINGVFYTRHTNQNGVAKFYHRINTQGVYDFHAVVGKTGASTRIYVSEIGNFVSFEVMSGGDYGNPSQNNGDYVKGAGITLGTSLDWSSNGERAIKMIKSGDSGTNVRFPLIGAEVPGETLKITMDCHIKGVAARVGIIQYDNNSQVLVTDVVAVSEGEFEMSKVLHDDVASVGIYVLMNLCNSGDILYIDNISATLGGDE